MQCIESILQQISSITKFKRKFLLILLTTLTYLPERINFRKLKRYHALNEIFFFDGFATYLILLRSIF